MFYDSEGRFDLNRENSIIERVINAAEVGLISWDIHQNKIEILENISDNTYEDIHCLHEFLEKFVFHKDYPIALQDLNNFLSGETSNYQSTFRIMDSNHKVRWVFCKGTLLSDHHLGAIMYDVTDDKFLQGHDYRTNLINVQMFMRKLKNAIPRTIEEKQKSALIYIDIENLLSIISRYGYEFGDAVLYKMSRMLLEFIEDTDEIATFPYDKFMILLNYREDTIAFEQVANQIYTMFQSPIVVEGSEIYLNIHLSITVFPEASTDADELIRYCDFAIRHSRKLKYNEPVYFDAKLMASYHREMEIENELPSAIINQELFLVYQPQLDLDTNKFCGFEVLVRWKNQKLGFVPPLDFIPLAEEKGYIIAMGRWIQRETMKTARRWLDMGIDFKTLSINVSSLEFKQQDFVGRLLKKCADYNIDPSLIEIEITERTLTETNNENKEILNRLLREGFKIAIDDFGIGYSNISLLMNFNINTLKLDKSLTDNMSNPKQSYFLQNIFSPGSNLSYQVIAEGVETQEEVDKLREVGCQYIQGYYFSKPLPMREMERFIFDQKRLGL